MTNTDRAVLEALEAEIPGVLAYADAGDHISAEERIAQYVDTLNRRERERCAAEAIRTGNDWLKGEPYATFHLDTPGRKFTRVVMETYGSGGRSVHAFVDREGHVFKPAGWASPAKGVRYDLMDPESRAKCFARCEFAGSYLYADAAGR